MEYIRVEYPGKRDVYINDIIVGITNEMFMIDSGHYGIHLGSPHDYEPDFVSVDVEDTAPIAPLLIIFNPR